MKTGIISLLLVGSVLGNILLFRQYASSPDQNSDTKPVAVPPHVAKPSVPLEKEAWSKLEDSDIEVFARKLAESGMPESLRKCILRARIREMFRKEDTAPENSGKQRDYWDLGARSSAIASYEERLAERRLSALRDLTVAKVLGVDDESLAHLSQKFSYAPKEKWLDLLTLMAGKGVEAESYASSIARLSTESERNRSRQLNDELEAGLKQLLTPAEYAEYKMRSSPALDSMRYRLAGFDGTETEFRTVLAAFNKMTEAAKASGRDYSKTRAENERIDAELKMSLGADRYADYRKSTDFEYRSLTAMCARLDLPETAASAAYACKQQIQDESLRIFDDKTMRYEEKLAALKQLAADTRSNLVKALGEEAGKAYINQAANRWIKSVEVGGTIKFTLNGSSSRRLMPDSPPGR